MKRITKSVKLSSLPNFDFTNRDYLEMLALSSVGALDSRGCCEAGEPSAIKSRMLGSGPGG